MYFDLHFFHTLTALFIEKGPVFGVRFSPFGKWLLSCSLDGTTYLWDMDAKVVHRQYRPARGLSCCPWLIC